LSVRLRIAAPASQSSSPIPFAVAVQLRRRGIEAKLVVHSSHGRPKLRQNLADIVGNRGNGLSGLVRALVGELQQELAELDRRSTTYHRAGTQAAVQWRP